jgi:chromosome partitioning protein
MADGISLINLIDDFTNLKTQPFDLILVDTPPYLSNRLPELFLQSDFILVPTKAGFFDMMAIKSTLALIQDTLKILPDLKSGIVFNMIKSSSSITSEIRSLTKDFSIPVLKSIISDRVSFTRSAISGGVLETNDEKAKYEIISLADEILSQLGL